jgi:catechol 2,3-dioxygenase-like lactoylglutathione lyase family enzyme
LAFGDPGVGDRDSTLRIKEDIAFPELWYLHDCSVEDRQANFHPMTGAPTMINHFDHVTLVVRDVEAAKQFFGLLGFKEDKSVVITGPKFSTYMGVDGIEAEHITLSLPNVSPRTEVQLLKYRHPNPRPDPAVGDLTKLGFNHVCFGVDDLEAEVARLKAKGIQFRNEMMEFQDRKLVFLSGPEGVTVELAE